MTALEQLGAFVATYRPDERACAGVRLHTADTIGAWIAARGTTEGRLLLAFRKEADALADRLAINMALARLSEIDDIHLGAMVTPGAIVIPAALTIAASLRDGYSTSGTQGGGLGAIRRMAATFDIYSAPGLGTAVLAHAALGLELSAGRLPEVLLFVVLSTAADVPHRFLDIDQFGKQPLKPELSGLEVEYRVIQLYSRDVGRRAAHRR